MRRRAVATLVLGAGVPMCVLAYLALRSVQSELDEQARAEERHARGAATAVIERLDDLFAHNEEALLRQLQNGLARNDPEPPAEEVEAGVLVSPALNARGLAVARSLEAVRNETLTREAFLISSQGRLVWPRVVRRPPGTHEANP